jgi:hypothetical protein
MLWPFLAARYVPTAPGIGFEAATRAITRLAGEGRKYGALALLAARPLSATGDRGFESPFLQRRVRKLSVPA